MHFLIYEFVTGGGWLFVAPGQRPHGSLLREGLAMLSAAATDFAALPDARVTMLWDARLTLPEPFERAQNCRVVLIHSTGEHDDQLATIAAGADRTLLIAPEFDQHLLRLCHHVATAGGRLLSPGPEFVALATDKHHTAEHLARAGVAVPHGVAVEPGDRVPDEFVYPAVLKPRDGAGSQSVRLLHGPAEFQESSGGLLRLEEYVRGQSASVAALCGPGGHVVLPPCSQRLTGDGDFTYLGGETPLADELASRVHALAEQAIGALPATCGYIGIDMVLGENGSPDVVIEVNPRLTTSYVGLRRVVHENLAAAMLQTADGAPPVLSLRSGRVEFTAAGEVTSIDE